MVTSWSSEGDPGFRGSHMAEGVVPGGQEWSRSREVTCTKRSGHRVSGVEYVRSNGEKHLDGSNSATPTMRRTTREERDHRNYLRVRGARRQADRNSAPIWEPSVPTDLRTFGVLGMTLGYYCQQSGRQRSNTNQMAS